jgi:hypothetical protein
LWDNFVLLGYQACFEGDMSMAKKKSTRQKPIERLPLLLPKDVLRLDFRRPTTDAERQAPYEDTDAARVLDALREIDAKKKRGS